VLSFADQNARDCFLAAAQANDIFAGIPLEQMDSHADARHLLVTTTEMIEVEDIDDYLAALVATQAEVTQ